MSPAGARVRARPELSDGRVRFGFVLSRVPKAGPCDYAQDRLTGAHFHGDLAGGPPTTKLKIITKMEEQRFESNAELRDPAQPAGSALPARIAILEGGGMRGCITAHFLLELEQRAGCPLWQLFDLVVGTSTGGILAALIVSGVPAAQMLEFYQIDGPKIFKRSPWWTLKTLGSAIGSKYNNRALIECIRHRL